MLASASCGGNPEAPPAPSSILATLDTRAPEALGAEPDSCLLSAVQGADTLRVTTGLSSGRTPVLMEGLSEGGCMLGAVFESMDSVIAEGGAGGFLPPGDTVPVELRVRFDAPPGVFAVDASWWWQQGADPPESVLFVGNSYTQANGGLDSILTGLVLSEDPGSDFHAEMIAFGGYTLEDHWNSAATMAMIARGGWDLVVLQEQSTRPVTDPELMYEYAGLMAEAIVQAGGRPGFFMTWARENDPAMIDPLSEAYFHAGALTDGMVSPAGLAWAAVRAGSPLFELYEPDGSHPNLRGTYLVVCTMYAAITGASPVGATYTNDPTMTPGDMLMLQETAWEAVQAYGPPDWRHF